MTWLKTAWSWLRVHVWIALVVMGAGLVALWRAAIGRERTQRRRADDAEARAEAAAQSAARERVVADKSAAVRAEHKTAGDILAEKAKAADAAVAAELARVDADAKRVTDAAATSTASLVAEGNRRMEDRLARGEP